MANDPRLMEQLRGDIASHLGDIATLFVPGTKLTFLARQPSHPDRSRDVVVSDDAIDDAVAALALKRTG